MIDDEEMFAQSHYSVLYVALAMLGTVVLSIAATVALGYVALRVAAAVWR